MDLIGRVVSGEPLKGSPEMRELALSALAALERAKLPDAARSVHERVFCRRPEALLDAYEENGVRRWRFKPMAELLLRELKHIASARHLPLDQRRRRIDWVMEIAGF